MINQDHAKFKNLWNEYQGPNMNGEMKQKRECACVRVGGGGMPHDAWRGNVVASSPG